METNTQTIITFERIGRCHDVETLTVPSTDANAVADAVWDHARRYLGSREYHVTVDMETGKVSIEFGRFGEGVAVPS